MFLKIIITYYLFFLSYPQFSPQCTKIFAELGKQLVQNRTDEFMQNIYPFVQLSGKAPYMFGDYDACQRYYQYGLLEFVSPALGALGSLYMGVCITPNCTFDEINQNIEQVKQYLIQNHYVDNIPINLNSSYVTVKDPENNYPDVTFGFFLTSSMMLILISLSLVIPISQFKKNLTKGADSFMKQPLSQQFKNVRINDSGMNSTFGANSTIVNEAVSQNQTMNREDPTYMEDLSFFKHFSLTHNWNQLTNFQNPDPNLTIFTGFRTFGFLMVVFGHQFLLFLLTDLTSYQAFSKEKVVIFAIDCFFAVDAFFWIGGFFLGFVMADSKKQQLMKKQGILTIPLALIHRLVRILPSYILTIMIIANVAPFIGGGPKWSGAISAFGNCGQKWYKNVLFVTIYNSDDTCVGWAWYLDNDIQIFLVGVLVMYIYCITSKNIGKSLIILLLIATQTAGTIFTFYNGVGIPYFDFLTNSFQKYYYKPWYRAPPYFLGLLIGSMYREYKTEKQNQTISNKRTFFGQLHEFTKKSNLSYWTFIFSTYFLGSALILWLSFGWTQAFEDGPQFWPDWFQELYQSFCRILYVLGMTLISIPNLLGFQDSFNNKFMNNEFFAFIAKLSFTGYLIHFIILDITGFGFYEHTSLSTFDSIQYYIGNMALTLVFATLMTLLVEIPFANLEQHFMKPKQIKPVLKQHVNQNYRKLEE